MNNSKADCSQLLYNSNCIYYPFLLSTQIQSVIKSLNGKQYKKLLLSQFDKKSLCFDHFYLVFDLNRPQGSMWLENFFVSTAKCWQTFNGFLQMYHSCYNEKLRVDKLAS